MTTEKFGDFSQTRNSVQKPDRRETLVTFINYPLGFTFYFSYYSGVLYSDSQLTIQRKATGSRGERKQKLSSVIRNDKKN